MTGGQSLHHPVSHVHGVEVEGYIHLDYGNFKSTNQIA